MIHRILDIIVNILTIIIILGIYHILTFKFIDVTELNYNSRVFYFAIGTLFSFLVRYLLSINNGSKIYSPFVELIVFLVIVFSLPLVI